MFIKKTTSAKRKSNKIFDLTPFMVVITLILLALTLYVWYNMQPSGKTLIPISVLALFAGVFYESKRLTDKRNTILFIAWGSFILSFFSFLPNKGEGVYDLEHHIEMWPYAFLFFFLIISTAIHREKIIPKLTEGITLLQSIAVIYWVIDFGFIHIESFLIKAFIIAGLFLSLYSIFHAFSNTTLSRTNRLTLSIWSSIIIMLFAADNIYRVYQNDQIESTADISEGLYIGLQYFLLGITSIYIVQNFFMLIQFLPGKGTFFNEQYFKDLKELKSNHIKRYSDQQVSILHSFFCVLFLGLIFFFNHYYQILPRHVAIWTLFVVFPFGLILYDLITKKKNYIER